jgi:signal transduction histidine kinase/CheY-like chemotaxis protein
LPTIDEIERLVAVERARLAETQAVARVGSWETDLGTLEVLWSAETYRIFGTDPANFAPSHPGFLQLVHPADRDAVDAAFRASAADGDVHTFEHRILTPGGEEKLVEERWRIFHGPAGPERAVGTCRDVTDQRRAEAEAKRSQALLRMASRLSRLGAWALEAGSLRVTWSDEVRALLDVEPSFEPAAEEGLAFCAPADVPRARQAFTECIVDGRPFDIELQLVTRRGRAVRMRLVGEAVRGDDGRVIRAQGALQDVTERRLLEERALRSQRLESLGTLAGGIAHDLNNVLAPILMATEILKRRVEDPRASHALESIEKSATRGASLVRQVLAFARGAGDGQREALALGHVAHDIARIVHETFPKDVAFELDLPPDLWAVEGDATQLHQVLVNLCVNARDAMPRGGRLRLEFSNEELDEAAALRLELAAGRYVVVRVSDTGHGVPAEIQERIFEPFFTTKEVGRGTGLGLSTSYSIVRGHGGALGVVSEPGWGATFTVHLPAAEGRPVSAVTTPDTAPQGRGELVLVVDDEPAIREVMEETLTAAGYRVATARDGLEALAVYEARRGDVALVLTDMAMPALDGAGLIAELRRRDPRLPIVASSGLHRGEGLAENWNIREFLQKPYSPLALRATVARALRDSR